MFNIDPRLSGLARSYYIHASSYICHAGSSLWTGKAEHLAISLFSCHPPLSRRRRSPYPLTPPCPRMRHFGASQCYLLWSRAREPCRLLEAIPRTLLASPDRPQSPFRPRRRFPLPPLSCLPSFRSFPLLPLR